jgi:hypothetical protein
MGKEKKPSDETSTRRNIIIISIAHLGISCQVQLKMALVWNVVNEVTWRVGVGHDLARKVSSARKGRWFDRSTTNVTGDAISFVSVCRF